MKNYKKYDDQIIKMIIESGNPNLFPHLKIPRTTALYWITKARKKISLKDTKYDDALIDKIKKLEKKLERERIKNLFLIGLIRKIIGFKKLLSDKRNREIIVDQILNYSKWISKNELCHTIGIMPNTFFRFKVETKGCERIGLRKCKIMAANQITFLEQQKIYELVNDKQLKHLSIKGLQLYAQRKNIVMCGYDSWIKYAKEFRKKIEIKKIKKCEIGVRASRVNEIWHMDITEFKRKGGGKIYLQVLIDNYSRKVVHWKMSSKKTQDLSLNTFREAANLIQPEKVITDGGGENTGTEVRRLFIGNGVKALVAKSDIRFSNSMVECFFRTLKHNYLNKYKHYKMSKLYSCVRKSIDTYNTTPLSSIGAATPLEVFEGMVDNKGYSDILQNLLLASRSQRHKVNKFCLHKNSI